MATIKLPQPRKREPKETDDPKSLRAWSFTHHRTHLEFLKAVLKCHYPDHEPGKNPKFKIDIKVNGVIAVHFSELEDADYMDGRCLYTKTESMVFTRLFEKEIEEADLLEHLENLPVKYNEGTAGITANEGVFGFVTEWAELRSSP